MSGKCLCGQVTFSTKGKPQLIAHCHCENCRRGSGTTHSSDACFKQENVIISGNVSRFSFKVPSGNTVERLFCGKCGAKIASINSGYATSIALNLGVFDDPENYIPDTVYFDASAPEWGRIAGNFTRYSTLPNESE